jgi:hypothetical protein
VPVFFARLEYEAVAARMTSIGPHGRSAACHSINRFIVRARWHPAGSARIRLMRCLLRELRDEDLAVLFEQWADPVAAHLAAFTAPNHMDRNAFERRWSRLRADETVIARVIIVDGEVVAPTPRTRCR